MEETNIYLKNKLDGFVMKKEYMQLVEPQTWDIITEQEYNILKLHQDTFQKNKAITIFPIWNYQENAKEFYKFRPYFYDLNSLFWLWNYNRFCYEITDEINILILFDRVMKFQGQTIPKSMKSNYLEAFKRFGREKIPKDAPLKWIQFNNKAFSIESYNIYEVTPDYFFTNPIPHDIGESDLTPNFDKLFQDWVGADKKQLLYEIVAYCVYRAYPINRIIALVGAGRNGKSTFLRILRNFLGNKNCTTTDLDVLVNSRFESSKLYKKLCCILGETNFGMMNNTKIIKDLTSGQDLISYEIKHKGHFEDVNYSKIIMASNSLPSSNDTSDGWFRRWMIIQFPNEFDVEKDIISEIPESEYESLVRKVIKIIPELIKNGSFSSNDTIQQRKETYILNSNPLSLFIQNHCKRESSLFCSYNELYTRYVGYLLKHKKRKVKNKEFKGALEDEGLFIEKCAKKINDEFVSGYYIIGLGFDLDNLDNLDNTLTLSSYKENKYNISPKSPNCPKIEEIFINNDKNLYKENINNINIWNFDKKILVYIKCKVDGCTETECNFDKHNVPYCEKHWNKLAN